jgi:hypothetical protein
MHMAYLLFFVHFCHLLLLKHVHKFNFHTRCGSGHLDYKNITLWDLLGAQLLFLPKDYFVQFFRHTHTFSSLTPTKCICTPSNCKMAAPNVCCRRIAFLPGTTRSISIVHNSMMDDKLRRYINCRGCLLCWNPAKWPYCCKADTIFHDSYAWVMENRVEWNVPVYCCWRYSDK